MDIEVLCPHCQEIVYLDRARIACGIYRHGCMITINGTITHITQLPPHLSQAECIALLAAGRVVGGCAKPIAWNRHKQVLEACDYTLGAAPP